MESNNPKLGDEMREDAARDAEPTPADTPEAEASEVLAESETPQPAPEALAAQAAPVNADESAADLPHDEQEAEAEPAPMGAVEPVAEDVTARPEPEALPIPVVPPLEQVPAEAAPGAEPRAEAEPATEPSAEAAQPDLEPAAEAAPFAEAPAATEEAAPSGEAPAEEPEGRFKRGDIITGTVVETSPTEVLVDVGEGLIGVIASRELERMDRAALEALQAGAPVTVYVLKLKGGDGRPVLSLARAEEESNWRLAEEHYQTKKVYFSKVAGYNKGGLIVRFGKVRGFVPASQVSRERQRRAAGENPEERWGVMVGEDIAVKVVEIDRSRNRLILSERAAAREWRERQKSHLLEDLHVGDVRKGRVISVADFGAFVDLGGADGLVHLTELSWQHVTHPREVVEVGQEVEVEVINIDRERKRIGLSMKRQANDPWVEIVQAYHVGQLVQATVTKLTKFGAFARLVDAPEIEGLIHISELADYRVTHPREVVLVGDVLTLRIVKIEPEQRRLGLSLRQVDSAKYLDQDWDALSEEFAYSYGSADEAPAAPTLESVDEIEAVPADTEEVPGAPEAAPYDETFSPGDEPTDEFDALDAEDPAAE